MTLTLAVPAIALILYSGWDQSQDAVREGITESRKLAYTIAGEQYNETGNARQLLKVVAQFPDIRNHRTKATNGTLAEILRDNPEFGNIIVADKTGNVWASGLPMTKSFSIKDRRIFKNAVISKQFSSGEYAIGILSALPTIGFGYPIITPGGECDGVIAVNINFRKFNEVLKLMGLPKGSTFSIIDHKGVIINRNLAADKVIGTKISADIFLQMKNGPDEDSFIHSGIVEENYLSSYRKLRLPGEPSPYLYIWASIPLKETQEKARRALLYNIAFFSPFLMVSVIMAIFMGNVCFVNRIEKLKGAAQLLAEGNLEIRASEYVHGGELGALSQSLDEMAGKLAARDKALVKSERDLDDLYNNAPCGYHSLDTQGTVVRINDTELKWLGYTRNEVIGNMTFADLFSRQSQQIFEKSFPLLKEQGSVQGLEFEMVRKDGSILPVLINASAMYDVDGAFVMSRSTAYDITDRKKAEQALNELNQNLAKRVEVETERRLRQERLLVRQARLAALGEMIGAIAHQWRQPLATLGATIQSIRMAWDRQLLDEDFLTKAEADAQKQLVYMSDTIEDFRNFFRPDKVIETFDAQDKVHDAVVLIEPQFTRSGIGLQIVDDPTGCRKVITGYQNEFKQALLNLVSNSFDAILEKRARNPVSEGLRDYHGLVVVSVTCHEDRVVIAVRDNGCGIPPENADKVFDPYFTSKAKGKGTGIGLYMTKLIIEESMSGQLRFSSGADGTLFEIELAQVAPETEGNNG